MVWIVGGAGRGTETTKAGCEGDALMSSVSNCKCSF